eukprot:2178439-Prymnesium_polylepis.1
MDDQQRDGELWEAGGEPAAAAVVAAHPGDIVIRQGARAHRLVVVPRGGPPSGRRCGAPRAARRAASSCAPGVPGRTARRRGTDLGRSPCVRFC